MCAMPSAHNGQCGTGLLQWLVRPRPGQRMLVGNVEVRSEGIVLNLLRRPSIEYGRCLLWVITHKDWLENKCECTYTCECT
eukprot:COSAG01_NODE_87_length_27454_cov_201.243575_24_plen_81_part_00